MKDVRVIKIVEEVKSEGVRMKKRFPETIRHKIFQTNSIFHVK